MDKHQMYKPIYENTEFMKTRRWKPDQYLDYDQSMKLTACVNKI